MGKFKVGDRVRLKGGFLTAISAVVTSYYLVDGGCKIYEEFELEAIEPVKEEAMQKNEQGQFSKDTGPFVAISKDGPVKNGKWCEHIRQRINKTWCENTYTTPGDRVVPNCWKVCPVCLIERPKEPVSLEDVIHSELSLQSQPGQRVEELYKAIREHIRSKEGEIIRLSDKWANDTTTGFDIEELAKRILEAICE